MEFVVEKIGMSRVVAIDSFPVTILKVLDAKVCEVSENRDFILVAYAYGKKMNNSIIGKQKKYNLPSSFNRFVKLDINKDHVNSDAGNTIDVSILENSTKLKAVFKPKGRGFSGVIKRWGFSGGPKTHGSRLHRKTGSIGMCDLPGRVKKNQKMPGRYSNRNVTVANEKISFDKEKGILVLKGSIPGHSGSTGIVRVI